MTHLYRTECRCCGTELGYLDHCCPNPRCGTAPKVAPYPSNPQRNGVTDDKQLEMWIWIAATYGWNELAKHAETLGEKVFFRTMRSTAQKQLDQYGVKVPYTADNPVVLEVPYGQLNLEFRDSDYELMRKALEEHDAKGGK